MRPILSIALGAAALATSVQASAAAWPAKATALEKSIRRYDEAVVGYRALAGRARQIRHGLILDAEYWVTLPLPEPPARIGGVGPEHLAQAPAAALAAFRQRLVDERDRGYRHWFSAAVAPARYGPFEPVDSDGEGEWSREVFSNWREAPTSQLAIPELSELLADLRAPAAAPRLGAVPAGLARSQLARLLQAVDAAEVYRVQVAGASPTWVNQAEWEQISGAAERASLLVQSDLAARRAEILVGIGRWMADLAQWDFLLRPGKSPEWDKAFDTGVLPLLPQPIRLELERRLAAAYFRGAWEAKRSQHDWWRRHGPRESEIERLKEAKAEWDLRRRYRYEL